MAWSKPFPSKRKQSNQPPNGQFINTLFNFVDMQLYYMCTISFFVCAFSQNIRIFSKNILKKETNLEERQYKYFPFGKKRLQVRLYHAMIVKKDKKILFFPKVCFLFYFLSAKTLPRVLNLLHSHGNSLRATQKQKENTKNTEKTSYLSFITLLLFSSFLHRWLYKKSVNIVFFFSSPLSCAATVDIFQPLTEFSLSLSRHLDFSAFRFFERKKPL